MVVRQTLASFDNDFEIVRVGTQHLPQGKAYKHCQVCQSPEVKKQHPSTIAAGLLGA